MPRDVLFDTALLRYCFDAVLAVGVTGTGSSLSLSAMPSYFSMMCLATSNNRIFVSTPVFWQFVSIHRCPSNEVRRLAFVRFAISVQLKPVKVQKMNRSRISS